MQQKITLLTVIFFCMISAELQAQLVKDIEGNIYKTVTIGTQVWMAENLKTTKYNDSTEIPLAVINPIWAGMTTPAFCWYNNDETANKNKYGALYNWYTVNTNKLCPTGWHIPTDNEWAILEIYLIKNNFGYEGSGKDIAKSMAATTGWGSYSKVGTVGNDQASNNRSDFTALPCGDRAPDGTFSGIEIGGVWWSSSGFSPFVAWFRRLQLIDRNLYRAYFNKKSGFSIRCIKD